MGENTLEAAMTPNPKAAERRRDIRVDCNDTIRWKRPGRLEDHKAWSNDRSPTSLSFITETQSAPAIGDVLHVRRIVTDRWAIENHVIRVARITQASSSNLTFVGCTLGEPESIEPACETDSRLS